MLHFTLSNLNNNKLFKQLKLFHHPKNKAPLYNEFVNCPPNKDINRHFEDQLTQLNIKPSSPEDAREIMKILNSYLGYPDDQLAYCHRNANKLGLLDLTLQQRTKLAQDQSLDEKFRKNIEESKLLRVNSNTCPCCGFIIQQHNIATCRSNLQNINHLGTANLVFFKTFMNIGILFLVMTFLYSVFAFITNIIVSSYDYYCNEYGEFYYCISIAVKLKSQDAHNLDKQRYYFISCVLGLLMLIIWWFLFIFQKRRIGQIENDANRSLGVSDYSVVIENMPIGLTQEEVEKQFNDYLNMLKGQKDSILLDQIKVVKYNEGKPFYLNESEFKDQELVEIHKNYNEVKDKIAGYVEEYIKNGNFVTIVAERKQNYAKFQELTQQKNRKHEEIAKEIKAKFNSSQQKSKTVVFVTFLTHEMQQFVLSHNKNTLFYRLKRSLQFCKKKTYFSVIKGDLTNQDIKIEQPPQPQDINWGNFGFSFCQKFWRRCITILVSTIMVGVGFAIVYGLQSVRKKREDSNLRGSKRVAFISYLIALVIILTNQGLQMLIRYMTVLEKDYSMNNFQISVAIKTALAQAFNSIAATFIIDYYIKSGLAQDIFTLAIYGSLLPPLFKLIDPSNIFLHIRYKYYSNHVRKLRLTQFELNEMSEKMQFQIGNEYIYLLSNYLFICFFVSMQPIICVFALLGLLLMYWIQKYSLLTRCQRPVPGPDVITSAMYQLIYLGPFFFAMGNITLSAFLSEQNFSKSLGINIVSLVLSIAMFIFPYDLCLPQVVNKENKNYYQRRIYFPSEYDRLNPSTSEKAIKEYRKFLNEKKREMQLAGNIGKSKQIFDELALIQQKNVYKGSILHKYTQNKQDFVIQQIFNNESKNVVNPRLLLSRLFPQIANQKQQLRCSKQRAQKRQLKEKDDSGIHTKLVLQQVSSRLIGDFDNYKVAPKWEESYLNVYHSNIRIDNILQCEDSHNPQKKMQ